MHSEFTHHLSREWVLNLLFKKSPIKLVQKTSFRMSHSFKHSWGSLQGSLDADKLWHALEEIIVLKKMMNLSPEN